MKICVRDYILGLIPFTKEVEVDPWTTIGEVKRKISPLPQLSLPSLGNSVSELSGGGFFVAQPAMASFWGGGVYGDNRTLETCCIKDGDLVDLRRL